VLALAGGVLLNLMPCVFPVLSIKAMSVVSGAGHDQRGHGLAYTAGVVLSFGILAAVLLALRAGGEAIGWGFQLQSPLVVGILIYVLFALGLSLSGLFDFGTRLMGVGQGLADKGGLSGSFFTGVLACVVASPCTAPFMGTALGVAVLMPWPMAMSIFLALGLGLALPMLALSFSPALARRLPRPGPWMETFKQAMAFPLYLAVVWLLWVLARQTDANGLAAVLAGMVVLAFALWLGGKRDRGPSLAVARHVAVGLSLILAVAALGTAVRFESEPHASRGAWWESYNPERLAELRADPDQAVLVNMTADWCVTCLVNERVALNTDSVRQAMAEHDVAYLKGDWTRRDPAITEYLAEFGRNGVPLYVLYPRNGDEPRVLPQVLTPGLVVQAVERELFDPFVENRFVANPKENNMTHRISRLLAGAILVGASFGLAAAPEIGQPAPDFSVVDTAGNTHNLSDFAGQKVILEWTNHDCPFVVKHYQPGNMQMQQRLARDEHDAVWLTVISSKPGSQGHVSPEQADELTQSRNAYPTAVLLDESGDMGRAYDARVTPHMYIIDEEGILRYMGGIDSNPSRNPDDIPDATQYVVAALTELAPACDSHPHRDSAVRLYGEVLMSTATGPGRGPSYPPLGMRSRLTSHFAAESVSAALQAHQARLERHGDLARWRQAQTLLPEVTQGWHIDAGWLVAGANAPDPDALRATLASFIPWRKGPVRLGGVAIETEWRSDLKWDRIAGQVDLTGKRVLDVGAGNGYFGWRMLEAGAELVVGCDPTQLFVIQHEIIGHFAGASNNCLLALRLEDLPVGLADFDTVFSMGVLYHRRDHLAHLRDLAARVAQGGELVLETLIIEGDSLEPLVPEDRYANMRNVHALPSLKLLGQWLEQAGYRDVRCLDVTATTRAEQRSTEWMPFHSLAEALDPNDPTQTREGHPAPLRALMVCEKSP
jgi:tRNA (mo5U34)-methyltransferase